MFRVASSRVVGRRSLGASHATFSFKMAPQTQRTFATGKKKDKKAGEDRKVSAKQVFGQDDKQLARNLAQQGHAGAGGQATASQGTGNEAYHGGPVATPRSISSDEEEYQEPPLVDIPAQSLDRAKEALETGTISTQYDPSIDKLMRALEQEYDNSQGTHTVHADGPEFEQQDPYAPDRRWSYLSMMRELREDTYVPKNPYMSNVVYDTNYMIDEPNILNHTHEHCGQYFPLTGDEEDALRKHFPEGIPGELGDEFEKTASNRLMIRKQGIDLVQELERFKREDPEANQERNSGILEKMRNNPIDGYKDPCSANFPFRLLMGPRGIGKSAILTYALRYARQNDWLTVCLPSSFKITQQPAITVPSRSRPGFLDQPDFAYDMLRHIGLLHVDQLKNIPQRRTYSRDRYLPAEDDEVVTQTKLEMKQQERAERAKLKAQVESQGGTWDPTTFESKIPEYLDPQKVDRSHTTLYHLVQWGIKHPAHATDCLLDFLEELKLVTEYPVLIAVDQINWLYEPVFMHLNEEPIDVSRVSIASAFRCLDEYGYMPAHSYKRGFFLSAESYRHSFFSRMYDQAKYPRKTHVPIEPLSRQEIHYQLLHYHHSGNFWEVKNRDDVDSHAVDYYRTLTDGNPRELRQAAMAVFT